MKISVTNLGAIKKATVEVGGLTVFVGPNGTGKSYLGKVIYGLQGFEAVLSTIFNNTPLLYEAIFGEPIKTNKDYLENLQRITPSALQERVAVLLDLHGQLFQENLADFFNDDSTLFKNTKINYENIELPPAVRLASIIEVAIETVQKAIERDHEQQNATPGFSLHQFCFNFLAAYFEGTVYYFPAARSNFMLTYKSLYRARADEHVGLESIADRLLLASKGNATRKTGTLIRFDRPTEDFISKLYDLDSSKASPLADIATKLKNQLYGDGHLLVEQPEGALPDFRYQVETTANKIRLHLASSMVTETGPLLIGFKHWVTPESLVIIDEPESHLHPEAQRALVNVLADAVNRGTKIIIITHSPYILSCVNNLIKYGSLIEHFPDDTNVKKLQTEQPDMVALKPNDVRAYHFGRDGLVKDIVQTSGLIDEAEFTVPFDDINQIYEAMRDIEWEHQA